MRKYIKIFLMAEKIMADIFLLIIVIPFSKTVIAKMKKLSLMALHLFSYLASWGMLRNPF